MSDKNSIDNKVLSFYEELPFNIYEDEKKSIQNIKNFNLKKTYPFLHDVILNSNSIIDIGCGGGWLTNVISYHYKKTVTGIDFNPVAIEFAKKISKKLKNDNNYLIQNIFDLSFDKNLT